MPDNNVIRPCGGKGICGKCKIKIISGNLAPNKRDKKFLTDKEIKDGFRIACGHNINNGIKFISTAENFKTVSQYSIINEAAETEHINGNSIIVDVGTTTLCFQLLNGKGNIIKTITKSNSQRAFGADVISRISKAVSGGLKYLCEMLKSDIKKGIINICEEENIEIKNIYIAGNTVMTYFLRDLDCTGLGSYPFENKAKDTFTKNASEFFPDFFNNKSILSSKVTILPCISAFIGGDILSGIYFLGLDKEENSIFIDIGTNSEIILNARGKLYAVSAAAGPAFEGGLISCGTGGVDGAINKIKYKENVIDYTTIGNKEPIGICGSALIDLTADLLENKIIDNTGLLTNRYFTNGVEIYKGIKLKQNDIRQIQLAKSAVRTGIDSIIDYGGIKLSDIKKVFIGGGFGFFLNAKSAIKIKMFPEDFWGKINYYGNTCLGGLSKIHKLTPNFKEAEKAISKIESIDLGNLDSFQDFFINNINF